MTARTSMRRRGLRGAMRAAAIAGLTVLSGCSSAPSAAECDRLLERVVKLQLAESSGATSPTGAATAPPAAPVSPETARKVTEYVGADFLATCKKDLPTAQLACGLRAKTLAELQRCDGA